PPGAHLVQLLEKWGTSRPQRGALLQKRRYRRTAAWCPPRRWSRPRGYVGGMAIPTHTLNDGLELPAIGFGTYPLKGEEAVTAIVSALQAGYRLIDTAVNYRNEGEVGEAIRRSGVPRDELVVTSKIPGRHHRYDDAVASTKESLQRLGLDHLDLHLIHW